MAETDEKRPWLAATLAFISPGLGHVYLREWLSAVLWFSLITLATTMLVPESLLPTEFTAEAILTASREMSRTLSWQTQAALMALITLSVVDAYRIAALTKIERAVEDGHQCPHCGEPLDDDLNFCHWCTTELVE